MDSDHDDNSDVIKRPRRAPKTRGASAGFNDALERLKQAKQSGGKNKHFVIEEDAVYDYVSEDKYSKMVENRQNDDWVVDDGIAEGYADDGREIFEDNDVDDYEDRRRRKSQKERSNDTGIKKNPNIMKPEDTVNSGNIKQMFEKSGSNIKKKRKDKEVDLDNADDILGDILGELRQAPTTSQAPKIAHPISAGRTNSVNRKVEGRSRNVFSIKPATSCSTEVKKEVLIPPEVSEPEITAEIPSTTEESNDIDTALLTSFANECEEEAPVKSEAVIPPKVENVIEQKPAVPSFGSSDMSFVDNFGDSSSKGKTYSEIAVDTSTLPMTNNEKNEKVMRVFWYDAYEDPFARNSHIYIFGKVHVESLGRYTSVCLIVKNVERRFYVLPREGYTFLDCREEISQLLASRKIMRERYNKRELGHVSTFDDPGIPASAQYLEVRYPAEFAALPNNLNGKTFSRIFGTSSNALETLLVEKKMKGPCWIDIVNPIPPPPSSPKVSWCKFEIHVPEARNISVFVPPPDSKICPPDFTLLSLSFRFLSKAMNSRNAHNVHSEIVSATGLINSSFRFDKPAPIPPFQEHFTIITHPSDARMPLDFKDAVKSRLPGVKVDTVPNERALLSLFVQKLAKYDPDIIVAHDFNGYQLDTLLNRLASNKVPAWSRIGGLVRNIVPRQGIPARNQVTSGRLVCDILHISKELVRLRSYDLTELAFSLLQKQRIVFEPEHVSMAYSNSGTLIDLVKAGLEDADAVLKIAYELNALPLANQLSQICGCLLSRVMGGGRSERNEWLLLHAFAERGYIPPEKADYFANHGKGRKPTAPVDDGSEDEDQNHTKSAKGASKRKPAYLGGLVLEPKKGFYDKFILLLDFNSLYPSIIQEFNICFTTVGKQHVKGEPSTVKAEPVVKEEPESQVVKSEPTEQPEEFDEVANLVLPSSSVAPGVLPSVLRMLVQSRQGVKKLMQGTNVPPDLMTQYDIRQRALKLTANSMYGCLGFTHSRFYARPLASLITTKGREILAATRDLVTNMGLDVVYGDTDSVMVNSNCTNFDEVLKLGQRIKTEVNKHYRLLEIDIDGVFKTMLLLKKKKYAALTISRQPDGKFKTREELRGLDIVRRDWCPLSRTVGGYVVTQILQSDSMERVVETISSKLNEVASQIANGSIDLAEFAIARQLARDPDNYADAKALPHVLVAQRLNKAAGSGRKFRAGDTMFYVICDDGNPSASHVQRAYHPDELTKPGSTLKIDNKYYLAQQVHPVVSRLCEPIPGLDSARIAELLGLDPSSYRRALGNGGGMGGGSGEIADGLLAQFTQSLESSTSNRFANCDKFFFTCPSCSQENKIDRVYIAEEKEAYFSLDKCQHCKAEFSEEFLAKTGPAACALKQQITQHITRYYAGWYMCEEQACALRTCRLTARLYRGLPLCPACERAPLVAEYSERQLYEQLLSYKMALDVDRASKSAPTSTMKLRVRESYDNLSNIIDSYLKQSLYATVSLSNIFSVCMPAKRKPTMAAAF